MTVNILAIGDVVGENGLDFLCRKLRPFKKLKAIDFTVVNGENASVVGILPRQADDLFSAGADVVTLGNHAFNKRQIIPYLEDNRYILRPSNLSPLSAGRGWGIFESKFGDVAVIDLIGRCGMEYGPDNPFFEADRILKQLDQVKVRIVDMHAEATSEKYALAFYLDGRVSAVWGTHTHVQTSDACVLPRGTGYITDLGMTGPQVSILGVKPEMSVARFLGESKRCAYEQADGPCKIEGAIFRIDASSGSCLDVEPVRILE